MVELPLTKADAASMLRDSLPGFDGSLVRRTLDDEAAITATSVGQKIIHDIARGAHAAVVVIGAFDGVHVGHRALVGAALRDARERGVSCVAVTFDPDPADVLFGPAALSHLLSVRDRERMLVGAGADAVVTFSFSPVVSQLSSEEFLSRRLLPLIRVAAVHVGIDFRFGRGGDGTVETLGAYGASRGFAVVGHPLVAVDGAPVTASRIRSQLEGGDVEGASRLLGRMHVVRGAVEHGRGEGTSFGFPTANVRCAGITRMPAAGVYGAYVVLPEGVAYPAAVNVGAPPTFTDADDPTFLEANLIGFEGDLYELPVTIAFCTHIRDAQRFSSLRQLERVIKQNIYWVSNNLGSGPIVLGKHR